MASNNKIRGNDKYNSPFACVLRGLMEGRGTTQDELAKTLGKTRQTVSQYVNGISEPTYDTLVKIADFFSVSIDFLLGRTKDSNITPSAVDELGLSVEIVEELKKIKRSSDLDSADAALDGVYECTITEIINRFLKKTLPNVLFARIALVNRQVKTLSELNIPEELKAHPDLGPSAGISSHAANIISVEAKLSCEIVEAHPELEGMLRVIYSDDMIYNEIDRITDELKNVVMEITGFRDYRSRKTT